MKQLSGLRKADRRLGDDTTLTRWVKLPDRGSSGYHTPLMAETAARTRFPSRVLPIDAMSSLLVSGHSNVKIGRDVRKGHFRGYWIYTLSLEERATCPRSCDHWRSCYGNSMPFAKRIDHTDPAFLPALERELDTLLATRGRAGVLVRLHALGDFYSVDYVLFWARMLAKHPRLAIFGYTARLPGTLIGDIVGDVVERFPGRAMIRVSNGGMASGATVSIINVEDRPAGSFVCPEQTGQTRACATCGACWSTLRNVAFLNH